MLIKICFIIHIYTHLYIIQKFDRAQTQHSTEVLLTKNLLLPLFYWILQADLDNSGTIDYVEFVAAMLHMNKVQKEDHLFAAFSYFDQDGSGYITKDELALACEKYGMVDVNLDEIIGEIDKDNVRILLRIYMTLFLHICLAPTVYMLVLFCLSIQFC